MTTLTPPDRARCQADKRVGNPFALGNPPRWEQCKEVPVVVIYEKQPGPDGLKGSMSLCAACKEEFLKKYGNDFADEVPILLRGSNAHPA